MASGVSAADIYHELIAQGASTVEALGIMANMINESGFNPEAVGDQGTSFGLVQQHGNYGHLVTGNPLADMKQQIQTLKGLGGFAAASGNTPQDAAGNFAANYERCVGCEMGGAQWSGRRANAATVVGYFKSGNWPQAGGGGAASSPGTPQDATLTGWNIPGPLGIPGEIASAIAGLWSNAGKLNDTASALTQIARGFTVVLHAFEWLFVPSHWVRIFAFGGGMLFLLPGLYALMKAANGTSGDVTLALGILLITISGILFFIAFHNLPQDVQNLSALLTWIAASIREGKPAASGATTTAQIAAAPEGTPI